MIAPAEDKEVGMLAAIDLEQEILKLKRQMNAVILAHYYQESEIQDLADFVGDSLQLSQKAAAVSAEVIVFCGVLFMAETAKILNPEKLVLLPDVAAGCSLADGCPASRFRPFRERYPDHIVISYINCSAEIKALSDIVCTSSNAEKIIRQIPAHQPILFAPDQHLGRYLIKDRPGYAAVARKLHCPRNFSERSLVRLKERHPAAFVLPTRSAPRTSCATRITSARPAAFSNMRRIVRQANLLSLPKAACSTRWNGRTCPGKTVSSSAGEGGCSCSECPHMKLNTVEKLYLCMRDRSPEITLDEQLRLCALRPIERMLRMS